jgi:RNA polymerase sigma-70 factor (ECF subfamily)
MPRLSAPEKFPSWLRGITHTIGQDVRRKAARERKHVQAAGQIRPRTSATPSEEVSKQEVSDKEQELLNDLVAGLPENCRIALDLRFREDLSYAQIAKTMGVPVSTVRGLLYRGTKALRQKMKPLLERTRGTGGNQ